MKAKELFESLDYYLEETGATVFYFTKTITDRRGKRDFYTIEFDKNAMTFSKYRRYNHADVGINILEYKAISKQIKELGWK